MNTVFSVKVSFKGVEEKKKEKRRKMREMDSDEGSGNEFRRKRV